MFPRIAIASNSKKRKTVNIEKQSNSKRLTILTRSKVTRNSPVITQVSDRDRAVGKNISKDKVQIGSTSIHQANGFNSSSISIQDSPVIELLMISNLGLFSKENLPCNSVV